MTYKKILLVDDDADDAEIFMDAIKAIDPEIHCTVENNAAQTLHKLRNGTIIPEIIFLDYRMPHLDGLEFLRLFRENKEWEKVQVMIYSGYLDPVLEDAVQRFDKVDFFKKNGNYQGLVEMLRAVIG
ncbi:response regulator [Flavobacterium sp. HJSW_4]|uniref:response regulator n=1 Tax=Flavobacterium sp. HJSW_4 TaxID=3344660 RepID=UPI0035F453C1